MSRLTNLAPNDAEAHIRLAEFQVSAGLPEDAEATLRRAVGLGLDSAKPQLALVAFLLAQNRKSDAQAIVANAKAAHPDAPIGFVLEGHVLSTLGDYTGAANAFEEALELQPAGAIAAQLYAARAKAGDPKGALAKLEKWADANPKQVAARLLIAEVYLSEGNLRAAAENYQEIADTAVAPLKVINNLAAIYHELNDRRALPLAELAFKANPKSALVLDTLGWILVDSESELERGAELLRRAVQLSPDNPEVRYHFAVSLAKSDRKEAARNELRRVLATERTFSGRADAEAMLSKLE